MSTRLWVGDIEIALNGAQLTVRCLPDKVTPAFVRAFERAAPRLREVLGRANEKWYGQETPVFEDNLCTREA